MGKRMKPSKLLVGAEEYRVVLLHVVGRTPDGRPRECRLVYDEETINLEGGEEFITAFVPSRVVAGRMN